MTKENGMMPQLVDVHVGSKVREARALRGLSQEQLAAQLGISFQQVQKYEKGTNRIGASRLWAIVEATEQPISFFFEGLNGGRNYEEPPKLTASAIKLARRIADMPAEARRPLLNFLNSVMDQSSLLPK